jgi:hypothetical protein
MSEGPNPVAVLVGIFLIGGGICITLVGGGCTIWLVTAISSYGESGDGGLLMLSLGTLGLGIFMLWGGIRLLKPRNDG